MRTLLEDLKEKNSPFYLQNMANLQKKRKKRGKSENTDFSLRNPGSKG